MRVPHQNQYQAAQSRGGGFGSKSLSRVCRRLLCLMLRPKDQKEPVPKMPECESIGGGCCFQGDATQAGEMFSPSRSLSYSEITDRLSSTSGNPHHTKRTWTPDSASAAAMMRGKRQRESQEHAADPRPMSVPKFNEYEAIAMVQLSAKLAMDQSKGKYH